MKFGVVIKYSDCALSIGKSPERLDTGEYVHCRRVSQVFMTPIIDTTITILHSYLFNTISELYLFPAV